MRDVNQNYNLYDSANEWHIKTFRIVSTETD